MAIKRKIYRLRQGDIIDIEEYHDGRYGAPGLPRQKKRELTKEEMQKVNAAKACVYSIDINSGAEADSGNFDEDAIRSDITFALCCYKPFHMLRKDHHLLLLMVNQICELLCLYLLVSSVQYNPEFLYCIFA